MYSYIIYIHVDVYSLQSWYENSVSDKISKLLGLQTFSSECWHPLRRTQVEIRLTFSGSEISFYAVYSKGNMWVPMDTHMVDIYNRYERETWNSCCVTWASVKVWHRHQSMCTSCRMSTCRRSHTDHQLMNNLSTTDTHICHYSYKPFDAHRCHVGTAVKHPVPDLVKPPCVIFDIRALWRSALSVRVTGCQKLQMTAQPGLAQDALQRCPHGNSGR